MCVCVCVFSVVDKVEQKTRFPNFISQRERKSERTASQEQYSVQSKKRGNLNIVEAVA